MSNSNGNATSGAKPKKKGRNNLSTQKEKSNKNLSRIEWQSTPLSLQIIGGRSGESGSRK